MRRSWRAGWLGRTIGAWFVGVVWVGGQEPIPQWLVPTGLHDGPAAELIREFLDGSGAVVEEGPFAAELAQRVGVVSRESSRLELVEAVCAQVGLVPVYSAGARAEGRALPGVVRFRKGTRRQPVAYAGPFLVEVVSVHHDAEGAPGRVVVQLIGLGLHSDPWRLQTGHRARLTEVRTADGWGHLSGSSLARRMDWAGAGTGLVIGRLGEALRDLEPTTRTLAEVEGTVSWFEVGAQHTVVVDPREPGANAEIEGLSLEVLEPGSPCHVRLGTGDRVASDYALEALDPGGRVLASTAGGGAGPVRWLAHDWRLDPERPGCRLLDLHLPESTRMPIGLAQVDWTEEAFVLEDVDVTRVEAPALAFPGYAAPVAARIVALGPGDPTRALAVEVVDHANLDLFAVQVVYHYLDESGAEVGSCPSILAGERQGDSLILAAAGTSVPVDTRAWFLPPSAVRVEVEVRRAEFEGGAVWTRDG